jgi:signal peptidase I
MKAFIKEWAIILLVGFLLSTVIRTYLFSTYSVEGKSMDPTLKDGNLLVINKVGNYIGEFEHFDVIVFHANDQEDYVKRVIGLPGDKIEYKQDILYINDKKVNEPFLNEMKADNQGTMLTGDFTLEEITGMKVVPKGHLFVEGDNRLGSFDSRHFGFIKQDQVVGKVNLRYWPVKDFKMSFEN